MSCPNIINIKADLYCPECLTLLNVSEGYSRACITHPYDPTGYPVIRCSRNGESIQIAITGKCIEPKFCGRPFIQLPRATVCGDCHIFYMSSEFIDSIRVRFGHRTLKAERAGYLIQRTFTKETSKGPCCSSVIRPIAQYAVFL